MEEDGQACGLFLSGMREQSENLLQASWVCFHMSSTCSRRMASMPKEDASADTFVGARGL